MQTNQLFFTLQEQYGMKYYQMPKVFFTNTRYKKLSNDAKILYALLLDRLQLSIKNKWIDSSDSLYFVYTNQNLLEILNVSARTITKVKKELMDAKLLKQDQKGFNTAFRLYLMKPEITVEDIYQINQVESGRDITPSNGREGWEVQDEATPQADTSSSPSSRVANSASLEKSAPKEGSNRVANSASLEESSSNQPSHSLANSARPVSQNLLPNKTYITNTNFKDNKDVKDQRSADQPLNAAFNSAFQNAPKETDGLLIEQFVKEKELLEKYGESFLAILQSYARNDFMLFREATNAVEYATKSAEKEAGRTIGIHFLKEFSPYAQEIQEDYFATLYRVLKHIRTNHKVDDPKAFFFVSFKNTAKHWIQTIELDESQEAGKEDRPHVPLYDWTNGE